MDEKEFKKQMPMGMATQYSKLIESSAYKYITENKRVKTPILKNLKELIDAFEFQILKGSVGLEMFCIWDLEVNVDKVKIHLMQASIDNSNLNDIKVNITGKASVEAEMKNFNKNWINFLQTFNKEFPNTEERFRLDAALFSSEIQDQFKELKKLREKLKLK